MNKYLTKFASEFETGDRTVYGDVEYTIKLIERVGASTVRFTLENGDSKIQTIWGKSKKLPFVNS